jgi:hypothetical protein
MRMARLLLLAGALAWSAPGQALPNDADAKATARRLAHEGIEHLEAGRADRAQEMFALAYRFVPAPTLAVLEGQALEKMGKLIEAEQRYLAAQRTRVNATSPVAFRRAVDEATTRLEQLESTIPRLTVSIAAHDVQTHELRVTLNEKSLPLALLGVPQPVDPGEYTISVAAGELSATKTITVEQGQTASVELALAPVTKNEPEPSPRPLVTERVVSKPGIKGIAGRVALAGGGAALAVGVVAGVIAVNKESKLSDRCTERRCPPSLHDDLDDFRTARTVSTVGYTVGATGIAAGLILLLTDGSGESPESAKSDVKPWIGHGIVGVKAKF